MWYPLSVRASLLAAAVLVAIALASCGYDFDALFAAPPSGGDAGDAAGAGSSDADRDGGGSDGGGDASLPASCAAAPCTGASCSYACGDPACPCASYRCGRDSDRCDAECGSAGTCAVQCDSREECDLRCDGCTGGLSCGVESGDCKTTCTRGSTCTSLCMGAEECRMKCEEGASCLLRCTPRAKECAMDCAGKKVDCGFGVIACDQPCPL